MIIIRVELHSAISRLRDRELARFMIANDGTATGRQQNYVVESYRGRDKVALDKRQVNRRGVVQNHPSEDEHVLNLVAKALNAMGYGQPSRASRRRVPDGLNIAARRE